MAFVVRRPNGTWEVRETRSTPAGPRPKTLATFRALTRETAASAAQQASTPTSPETILASARRAGAFVPGSAADAAAAELLRLCDQGVPLSERVRRAMAAWLGPAEPLPPAAQAAAPWSGVTPEERGAVLVDLLSLADALPPPRLVRDERFPRLVPR